MHKEINVHWSARRAVASSPLVHVGVGRRVYLGEQPFSKKVCILVITDIRTWQTKCAIKNITKLNLYIVHTKFGPGKFGRNSVYSNLGLIKYTIAGEIEKAGG